MPYVTIDILKRDIKKKRDLAREVTKAVVSALKCPVDNVHVIINEMNPNQHAVGGVLSCDRTVKNKKKKK